MASVSPRKDSSGNVISYQIRVSRGRDSNGKRLKDYMLTWKPQPDMTKRQIEKELERQSALFEESCKNGLVATEKPTFAAYAEYVLKTYTTYRALLPRINAEIGHLKIQSIRVDHLNRLYKALSEPGQTDHRACH